MNLMLVPEAVPGLVLARNDPRALHVRKVLGLKTGDAFDVGAENGPRGKATILADDATGMNLSFAWGVLPPEPLPLRLYVGLSRPQTMRKILREAAALGVAEIGVVRCIRSEASYADSSLWTTNEWREQLVSGVEQSFSTFVPKLVHHESVAAALGSAAQACEILMTDNYEATAPFAGWQRFSEKPLALFVGPERGWDGPEREAARRAGAAMLHLGPRVLRTETAVTAAVMLASARMGALDRMN
ncbi:MAG TPA: RsmE family RNA methyltransferase [Opitutales bacterium]|nr:RsmE family RNA methyltransferase [Opitutales bacterium]